MKQFITLLLILTFILKVSGQSDSNILNVKFKDNFDPLELDKNEFIEKLATSQGMDERSGPFKDFVRLNFNRIKINDSRYLVEVIHDWFYRDFEEFISEFEISISDLNEIDFGLLFEIDDESISKLGINDFSSLTYLDWRNLRFWTKFSWPFFMREYDLSIHDPYYYTKPDGSTGYSEFGKSGYKVLESRMTEGSLRSLVPNSVPVFFVSAFFHHYQFSELIKKMGGIHSHPKYSNDNLALVFVDNPQNHLSVGPDYNGSHTFYIKLLNEVFKDEEQKAYNVIVENGLIKRISNKDSGYNPEKKYAKQDLYEWPHTYEYANGELRIVSWNERKVGCYLTFENGILNGKALAWIENPSDEEDLFKTCLTEINFKNNQISSYRILECDEEI